MGHTYTKKIIQCLSVVQISLGVLYVYLLNLAILGQTITIPCPKQGEPLFTYHVAMVFPEPSPCCPNGKLVHLSEMCLFRPKAACNRQGGAEANWGLGWILSVRP